MQKMTTTGPYLQLIRLRSRAMARQAIFGFEGAPQAVSSEGEITLGGGLTLWAFGVVFIFMPTVLRIGKYRFHFYSGESHEPPHTHVRAGDHEAKFWLEPVRLARNHGFAEHELGKIHDLVKENCQFLIRAYIDFHERE